MVLDEGFEVEGSAVEGGAFDPTIHRKDCVDGVDQEIVVHRMKKAPVKGPL